MSFGINPQFKISCRIYEKKVKIYIYLQQYHNHHHHRRRRHCTSFRQHYFVSDDEKHKRSSNAMHTGKETCSV
jgi:hypothetical protein